MKAFVSALACLVPLATFAAEEDAIIEKALAISRCPKSYRDIPVMRQ
jgi:hypothetical protein